MASGTALGLLFFAGLRYGSILAVCPFLIIAIGVDDAFLMIHAWQRVSKRMQREAKVEDTVANRLSMVSSAKTSRRHVTQCFRSSSRRVPLY